MTTFVHSLRRVVRRSETVERSAAPAREVERAAAVESPIVDIAPNDPIIGNKTSTSKGWSSTRPRCASCEAPASSWSSRW